MSYKEESLVCHACLCCSSTPLCNSCTSFSSSHRWLLKHLYSGYYHKKSLPCLGLSRCLDSLLLLSFSVCLPLSVSLRHSLCLSASLSLCVLLSSLVLTNWSCSRSLPGSCTTPQTRVETGSSRSQSEAWKNEGGGGWEEAALCVHIRVCVCVCVAGSPRVPPPPPRTRPLGLCTFHLCCFFCTFTSPPFTRSHYPQISL